MCSPESLSWGYFDGIGTWGVCDQHRKYEGLFIQQACAQAPVRKWMWKIASSIEFQLTLLPFINEDQQEEVLRGITNVPLRFFQFFHHGEYIDIICTARVHTAIWVLKGTLSNIIHL